jgi:hypothetical protein
MARPRVSLVTVNAIENATPITSLPNKELEWYRFGHIRNKKTRGVMPKEVSFSADPAHTARLHLSAGPVAIVVESQKSKCASGEARGGRGLATLGNLTP